VITIGMKGAEDLTQQLEELRKKYPEAAGAALYQEAQKIMADSVKRTPVASGALRQSAYVGPPHDTGGKLELHMGYGKDYALPVHERLEAQHDVGEAKFLENALHEAAGKFQKDLGDRIQANAERGVTMGGVRGDFPKTPSED
jgi:bacteriophage HK97-gp10 putative tail-component